MPPKHRAAALNGMYKVTPAKKSEKLENTLVKLMKIFLVPESKLEKKPLVSIRMCCFVRPNK